MKCSSYLLVNYFLELCKFHVNVLSCGKFIMNPGDLIKNYFLIRIHTTQILLFRINTFFPRR